MLDLYTWESRSDTVEAMHYNPECCVINSWWCQWDFSLT